MHFTHRIGVAVLLSALAPSSTAAQREAPRDAPSRITIADTTERGTRLQVSGRVVDTEGRPIPGASIYAYHTDANGQYVPGGSGAQGSDRPRLFGYLRSGPDGSYAFSTIMPGSYPGTRNPGHIHFEVVAANHSSREYEIVFEGDPFISENFRAQAREPLGGVEIVTSRPGTGRSLDVRHDIRLRVR